MGTFTWNRTPFERAETSKSQSVQSETEASSASPNLIVLLVEISSAGFLARMAVAPSG